MAIDFPASPATGSIFDPGTGIIYSYDGVAWNTVTTSTATARAKNLLINPAMMISQENGSTAVTANIGYPVDQWALTFSGVVGQATQIAQITPERSLNAVGTTVTTAKASLAAGDYDAISQPVEGLQMAELQWGTSRAIPAVLRFSAAATAVGTYSVALISGAGDQTYIGVFTATSIMQPFVIAIPAVTVGTWAKDNTRGATLRFCHCCGTTNTGVLGWQSGGFFAGPGQINAAATANQNLTIADVGLYADPAATGLAPPFVIPEIATELVKCCRYWNQYLQYVVGIGGVSTSSTHVTPMRIAPTFTGGGAGFSAAVNNPNSFVLSQTTRGLQNIVASARM